jgi:hypothetical protein
MMIETRKFSMHPALLMDVIKRQAGSVEKSLLEGVMNGVDAKANEIRVSLAEKLIIIEDDGQGFRSREEIESWFETFGQPHDESEAKVYGNFRMGRGQMFAFGVNTWRTGEFRMKVDIKNLGLDYELEQHLDLHQGCRIEIELYEPLLPSRMQRMKHELAKWCKYVDVPVIVDGKQISTDPAKEKWDHVTEHAYVRLRSSGSLTLYNLGVFVEDFPAHRWGSAGEVVSRQQLRLNFARNDVLSDCKVWKKITPLLKQIANRKASTPSKKLTNEDRHYFAQQIATGEIDQGEVKRLRSVRLLTDVTGAQWSLAQVEKWLREKGISRITVAPLHDAAGDKLMQRGETFVLANVTMERFGCQTAQELVDLLKRGYTYRTEWGHEYKNQLVDISRTEGVELKEALRGINTDYRLLREDEMTPTMTLLLPFLGKNDYWLHRDKPRVLLIGDSDIYAGWTDGRSYITLEKRFFTTINMGIVDWHAAGHTLCHEYSHFEESFNTHLHGIEFYKAYHDRHRNLGDFVDQCIHNWGIYLKEQEKNLPQKVLAAMDRQVKNQQAVEKMGLRLGPASDATHATDPGPMLSHHCEDCWFRGR